RLLLARAHGRFPDRRAELRRQGPAVHRPPPHPGDGLTMSAHGSGERSHAPLLALLRAVGRALQGLPRSLALLPVGAWMALIWWLSSLSGDAGPPSILGGFVNNLAHAPLFGLLALWLALLLPRSNGWPRLDRRTATQVLLAVL